MSYRGRINDFPMEPPKPDMLMWELRVKQLEARVAELEKPWRAIDGMDWEYLYSQIGYGGRDRFWRTVLTEMQLALTKGRAQG